MIKGIVIGLAVVVIAVGIFFVTQNKNESSNETSTESMSSDDGSNGDVTMESESVSGTFSDLLALGQNYECTYEITDEQGNQSSGKVYVADSGDKMYGEFSLSMEEIGSYDSYIIRDGTYNYIWSSQQPQGIKMTIDEEDESFVSDDNEDVDYGVDYNQNYSFDCDPWSVDDGIFVPPNDVDFVDFSSMMEEITEGLEGAGIDCSICNEVPEGDARTQCLTSLGC
ncbi:hypothetical protein ACFL2C_02155 [Patescibacteria group bacterium]